MEEGKDAEQYVRNSLSNTLMWVFQKNKYWSFIIAILIVFAISAMIVARLLSSGRPSAQYRTVVDSLPRKNSLPTCGTKPPSQIEGNNTQLYVTPETYVNFRYGFVIDIPPDWTIQEWAPGIGNGEIEELPPRRFRDSAHYITEIFFSSPKKRLDYERKRQICNDSSSGIPCPVNIPDSEFYFGEAPNTEVDSPDGEKVNLSNNTWFRRVTSDFVGEIGVPAVRYSTNTDFGTRHVFIVDSRHESAILPILKTYRAFKGGKAIAR